MRIAMWQRDAFSAGRRALGGDHRLDEAGVVIGVIARQSRRDLVERELRQYGDAVECLLAMHGYVVAERLEGLPRERIVDALGLLQTSDIWLPLAQPGQRIVHALLDGIDVPGCDSHGCRGAWRGPRGSPECPSSAQQQKSKGRTDPS